MTVWLNAKNFNFHSFKINTGKNTSIFFYTLMEVDRICLLHFAFIISRDKFL